MAVRFSCSRTCRNRRQRLLEAEGKDRGVVWDDNLDLDSAEEHPYMQLNPDAH
jgi:hypothetical protein